MADQVQWRRARYGDTWRSTHMIVAVRGGDTDLSDYHIRAQARAKSEDPAPTFEWSVAAGTIETGTSELLVKSGATVQAGVIQLLIRPGDWAGKPRKWRGLVDVELTTVATDGSGHPQDNITIVQDRPFYVDPDIAR